MPNHRILLLAILLGGALVAEDKAMTRFDFESDSPGGPPRNFELALTGKGGPEPGWWRPFPRANALEDNVHLYRVVAGKRIRFDGWNGKVRSGIWHDLAIEMVGDRIQVFYDGAKVIEARDATFAGPGKSGVWTKADSRIQFDDLTATPK